MIRHTHSVRRLARQISDAADVGMSAYSNGRVNEEPKITERILGAIEDRVGPDTLRYSNDMDGYARDRFEGRIIWNARSLQSSAGRAAEESRHGADLMGILDIKLPGYRVTKGFLAQAKRAEPNQPFNKNGWEELITQCKKMLNRSPDSFVWVYSKIEGLKIFPAIAVTSLKSRNIFDLYSRSMSSFFESHLECFIGDQVLNSTSINTLDDLPDRILLLTGRYENLRSR